MVKQVVKLKFLVVAAAILLAVVFNVSGVNSGNGAWADGGTMIGSCDGVHRTFFGLKPWFEYLEVEEIEGKCEVAASNFSKDNAVSSVWKIVLTIVYDLNLVAVIAAVGMAIYAGVQYLMSSGDAGVAASARKALINSLIGLAIVALAAVIVNVVLWVLG